MIKVFFDGNCPICNREIMFYKRLAKEGSEITWYDISQDHKPLKIINKTKQDCLKRLHVLDQDQSIKVGVDAFITIWKKIKYFSIIALLINNKPTKKLLNTIYNFYADYRYKKLKYKE